MTRRRVVQYGLRPYQAEQPTKIAAALTARKRVLAQAPTGSGKTIMFCDLVREVVAAGLRVLILTHRDEIQQQVSRALRKLGIKHGFIAPGYPATTDLVQVASVMSLVRRLPWLERHPPQLVIIDECHHVAANTWKKILDVIPDSDLLGVTATPRRLDGKPLCDYFDVLIIGPSISELIDDEYLSPVTVFTPARSPDLSQVRIRAGDYAVDQLSDVMSRDMIVNTAVTEYQRLCPGVPAIAFCVDIRHSKLVTEAFRRANYAAEHVDGNTPRRERRDLMAYMKSPCFLPVRRCRTSPS